MQNNATSTQLLKYMFLPKKKLNLNSIIIYKVHFSGVALRNGNNNVLTHAEKRTVAYKKKKKRKHWKKCHHCRNVPLDYLRKMSWDQHTGDGNFPTTTTKSPQKKKSMQRQKCCFVYNVRRKADVWGIFIKPLGGGRPRPLSPLLSIGRQQLWGLMADWLRPAVARRGSWWRRRHAWKCSPPRGLVIVCEMFHHFCRLLFHMATDKTV